MNTEDLVSSVSCAIEDIKGKDIVAIDVSKTSSITDVMMICTGTSTRHTCAIAEKVCEAMHKISVETNGIEGENPGDWVLIDLGRVVVHVMIQEARDTYQLEELYRFGA
ncbi:MAG: ribosome silencing factor [Succinivibrionaceae bacterium]